MAESDRAVYAAIAGNAAVAVTKFIAAAATGSAAMLSEGFHSVVDTGDGALLLLGRKRSNKPPDALHPFGHGHELYFWTLIVAVMIFAAGGGVSAYEGVLHVLPPNPSENATWSYVVLGLAAIFEGSSLVVAWKNFREIIGDQPIWKAIRTSKDPTIFTVVFEDTAALVGLTFAFLGIFLSEQLGNPVYAGIASILIGVTLMTVAVLLVRESKSLLTGDAAEPEMLDRILAIARSDEAVSKAAKPLTMYLGPNSMVLALELQFHEHLNARQLATAVERIEGKVRAENPKIRRIVIEARSLDESGRAA